LLKTFYFPQRSGESKKYTPQVHAGNQVYHTAFFPKMSKQSKRRAPEKLKHPSTVFDWAKIDEQQLPVSTFHNYMHKICRFILKISNYFDGLMNVKERP